ncbi:MAG: DUF1987 domain-containing protein [Bacteroidales bacterium]
MLSTKKILNDINQVTDKDLVTIDESERTPKIFFDKHQGLIKFTGRAMPDNAKLFFAPLLEWIERYVQSPQERTCAQFNLEYFNSSASKLIMQMIATLKEVKNKGKELNIEWYYMEDDDDMLDTGKTFEELTELEFEYFCY